MFPPSWCFSHLWLVLLGSPSTLTPLPGCFYGSQGCRATAGPQHPPGPAAPRATPPALPKRNEGQRHLLPPTRSTRWLRQAHLDKELDLGLLRGPALHPDGVASCWGGEGDPLSAALSFARPLRRAAAAPLAGLGPGLGLGLALSFPF